jgi:phage terminase large subunit-like protein
MRSGQLNVKNKLGCIISTKYPTAVNPFEDEVDYAKKVLDGVVEDDTVFALLYEPDETKAWASDDLILQQGNPAALEREEIWLDLVKKRKQAIEKERARENFLTKHCNITYQGAASESFISIDLVKACEVEKIDFSGKNLYIGVDLSQTNDNCAVAVAAVDENENIIADVIAFVPEGRIDEKEKFEKVDYRLFINQMKCIACGDMVVDYSVIEDFVNEVEDHYGGRVVSIGYDRYNAISSAQKWAQKYTTVEVRQHSDTLHPATKCLSEHIESGKFRYEKNDLLVINFENARCTYDTNLNRYVNKKKSNGKVDMVVALINAVYLLNQDVIFGDQSFVQII